MTDQHDREPATLKRRSLLYGTGLVGLLGYGAATARADPRGQVGTADDPLRALYTVELNGGLTGDQSVTTLAGGGLQIGRWRCRDRYW